MRCDLVLPCVRDVARNQPEVLQLMEGCFTGTASAVRDAGDAIRAVVNNFLDSISGMGGRMTKTHDKASAYNDLQILRACWITSYWLGAHPCTRTHERLFSPCVWRAGYEFKEVARWGFCHAALNTEGVEVLPGPPPVEVGQKRARAHNEEEEHPVAAVIAKTA